MRRKKKSLYSIKAIAEKAGVSPASVSRCLNGTSFVSEEKKAAIMKAAEAIGYRPDPFFRNIAMRKNGGKPPVKTLAILLQTMSKATLLSDLYWGRIFWSIEGEMKAQGKHLAICTVDEKDTSLPELVKDMRVDGVFIVTPSSFEIARKIQEIIPIVAINTPPQEGIPTSSVMPDEASGIRKALAYLQELGHQKIFFLDMKANGNYHHNWRMETFAAKTKNTLPQARIFNLPETDALEKVIHQQMQQWKESHELPTAIICGGDFAALAVLASAHKLGIRIPEDVSVIGGDDFIHCEYSIPKLTTIRQPFEEMGKVAVRRLIEAIEYPDTLKSVQTFETSLIIRESCCPPHQ